MRSIWKYELSVTDVQVIQMPEGAELLCVQNQRGVPCVWALVETSRPKIMREIHIFGTGRPCDSFKEGYVGTFQLRNGDLVFHVFDVGEIVAPPEEE